MVSTATWAPVCCSNAASFCSILNFASAGIMFALSFTRPERNGTASSAARGTARARRQTRSLGTRRSIGSIGKIGNISGLPAGGRRQARSCRRVAGLRRSVRKLSALADRQDQGLARPSGADAGHDALDDAVPMALLDLPVDPGVAQHHHPVLEEREEEKDAGPVAGAEHLLLQESPLGALPRAQVEEIATGEPALDRGDERGQRNPMAPPAAAGRAIQSGVVPPQNRPSR